MPHKEIILLLMKYTAYRRCKGRKDFKTGMKKSYKVYAAEIYNLEMICAKENGGKDKSLPPLI